MSIRAVKAKNFQSLHDVELPLDKLTVIVGPSNSGKSAFGRALRTAIRNTSGASFVTHGHKTSTLTVTLDDGETQVALERGPSHSVYRTVKDGKEETYVKSGKEVPEDVAKLLNMPPVEDTDIYLTTQFDGPFLLAESGIKVSQIIGSLTNVTLLAEAAKEANRRRLEAARLATQRRKDAEAAKATIKERFSNLPAKVKAVAELRTTFEQVQDKVSLVNRVVEYADRASAAALAREQAEREEQALGQLLSDADLGDVEKAAVLFQNIRTALEAWSKARQSCTAAQEQANAAEAELSVVSTAFDQKMKESTVCPLCNQSLT